MALGRLKRTKFMNMMLPTIMLIMLPILEVMLVLILVVPVVLMAKRLISMNTPLMIPESATLTMVAEDHRGSCHEANTGAVRKSTGPAWNCELPTPIAIATFCQDTSVRLPHAAGQSLAEACKYKEQYTLSMVRIPAAQAAAQHMAWQGTHRHINTVVCTHI